MHTCLPLFLTQTLRYLLLAAALVLASCNSQNKSENVQENIQPAEHKEPKATNTFTANITAEMGSNILSIFQDIKGYYWFGTQSMGVYRYEGKTLLRFTEKDGLANNQVQTIQEDATGNIWFGTGVFGVSRFDGQTFTTFTNQQNIPFDKVWNIGSNNLLFYAGGGAYRFNNNTLTYLPFPQANVQSPSNQLSAYAVYSMLKDRKGHYWFGTQSMGVARYDGNSFTWFTEKGLAGPAVLALFEDRNGNLWFGNNGSGLFKYDGKSLTNFTTEKGLGNPEFFKTSKVSVKSSVSTMLRIYSINEDNNGNIWVGTVDAGVWKYDGRNLTNYTTKDGLASNAVTVIYKDKKGELWFGTEGKGVYKLNGTSFTAFAF